MSFFFLCLSNKIFLSFWNDHVRETDSSTKDCCILISKILYAVQKLYSNRWLLVIESLCDKFLELLIAKAVVLERNTKWDRRVEDDSSWSCFCPSDTVRYCSIALFIYNYETFLETIVDLFVIRNTVSINCSFDFCNRLKVLPLLFSIKVESFLCEVVDTKDHVL